MTRRACPGWNSKPAGPPRLGAGVQVLSPSCTAFPSALAGSWMESRVYRSGASVPIWNASIAGRSLALCHNTSTTHFLLDVDRPIKLSVLGVGIIAQGLKLRPMTLPLYLPLLKQVSQRINKNLWSWWLFIDTELDAKCNLLSMDALKPWRNKVKQ